MKKDSRRFICTTGFVHINQTHWLANWVLYRYSSARPCFKKVMKHDHLAE